MTAPPCSDCGRPAPVALATDYGRFCRRCVNWPRTAARFPERGPRGKERT